METNSSKPSLIEIILYYIAGFMLFSSFVYGFGNTDKWFTRIFLSVVAIGFAGVIREIRKSRK